jgi:predicted ABC-type ATPase
MLPTLCLLGGCNGAGKTTLARELLPRLGIRRFLNADEIARGLSPLDPSLSAFRAGRILLEEMGALLGRKESFGLESTLSGKTYVSLLRDAREKGYRIVLHYILIGSADQAVGRVALRVTHGGHDVPEEDIRRRFDRSRRHFLEDYMPLADEWVLWDNSQPPHIKMADHTTHTVEELRNLVNSITLQEESAAPVPDLVRIGLAAGQAATAKMLDFYKRMGIRVTPEMTLAPEPKRRPRRKRA